MWHFLKSLAFPSGKLYGRYYNRDGSPTAESHKIQEKLLLVKKEKALEEKQDRMFPPCNVEWNRETGTVYWCTERRQKNLFSSLLLLTVLTLKKNETSLLVCSYMIHFCLTVVELIEIGREYQECYLRLQVHRVHLDALVLNWIVKSMKRIKRDLKNTMAVTSTRRSAS